MTFKSNYEEYLNKRNAFINDEFKNRVWVNQERKYVKPFQIYGNIYYVGDEWVCTHLIDTGDGLLLIDSGNTGATAMLIQAIWECGFNPRDVKWIITSHGHVDHIGSANFFKNMFGTKLYLGEPDAKMFLEKPELAFIQDGSDLLDSIFVPDVIIKEGDKLTFGNMEFEFYLVPGHTDGCLAFFFDLKNGDETIRAGYYGGFGFNTLTKDFLVEIGDLELNNRKIYLESINKVKDQPVDIFIPNHCVNNDLLERHQKNLEDPSKNHFVDKNLWKNYLTKKAEDLVEFMNDPANN